MRVMNNDYNNNIDKRIDNNYNDNNNITSLILVNDIFLHHVERI